MFANVSSSIFNYFHIFSTAINKNTILRRMGSAVEWDTTIIKIFLEGWSQAGPSLEGELIDTHQWDPTPPPTLAGRQQARADWMATYAR